MRNQNVMIMGSQKKVKVKVFDSHLISQLTQLNADSEDVIKTIPISKKGKAHKEKIKKERSSETKGVKLMLFIFSIIGIIGICASIVLSTIDMVYFLISTVLTIISIAIVLILYLRHSYVKDIKEYPTVKDLFENMNPEDKRLLALILAGFGISGILLIVSYWLNTLNMELSLAIIGINILMIGVILVDRITLYRKQPSRFPKFNPNFFIIQCIIYGVLIIFLIPLICGLNILSYFGIELTSYDSINIQFNLCMVLVAISGIVGIFEIRTELHAETDLNRTGLIRYLIMILLPVISLILYPISTSQIQDAIVFSGQLGDFDYFNGIYIAIVSDRYTLFSMVFIVISALVIIVGKARGQSGSATMVIGSLGMAGIPMIITIMAFIGQVPAPPQYYELFGEGFAELIFAISYTSVISLALALVGVFYEIVPSAVSGNLDD